MKFLTSCFKAASVSLSLATPTLVGIHIGA